jgi:hypothetical protein
MKENFGVVFIKLQGLLCNEMKIEGPTCKRHNITDFSDLF